MKSDGSIGPMLAALFALGCLYTIQQPPPDAWDSVRRGSWVREGNSQKGDLVLARSASDRIVITIPNGEKECVRQAAKFLQSDLKKLTGVTATIGATAAKRAFRIELKTEAKTPPKWESYSIHSAANGIQIRGSNPRGTAFGVYELCERLGVDPLYRWTGIEPKKHLPFVIRPIQFHQEPPEVKFRGLFHDDEDILPRPYAPGAAEGGAMAPDPNGAISLENYKRYFETALRLRMNMVAPWVRTSRYFSVQQLASDWGLYYTSHHYDTLLSDPYHFTRAQKWTPFAPAKVGLAELRNVQPIWDFVRNRDGMIQFWKGGVDENHSLDCIWPVGLRGTNDYSYRWPDGLSQDQILMQYEDAINTQTALVKEQVPESRERLFHFTMYTEMLPYYQTGKLRIPDDVIIVWPDNNDGVMRGLPEKTDKHKHGVYYHLAYLGGNIIKQTHQVISPSKIESDFRKIFAAGAKEYVLVNVSELREYVLGTRMIADIAWNGTKVFDNPNAGKRFLHWWAEEYFRSAFVGSCYQEYFDTIPETPLYCLGAKKCMGALPTIRLKLQGKPFSPLMPETLPTLKKQRFLQTVLSVDLATLDDLKDKSAGRFLFENLILAAELDRLNNLAAIELCEAIQETDRRTILRHCHAARPYLSEIQRLLQRAERPPFQSWYGMSWINDRNINLHLPLIELDKLLKDFPQ